MKCAADKDQNPFYTKFTVTTGGALMSDTFPGAVLDGTNEPFDAPNVVSVGVTGASHGDRDALSPGNKQDCVLLPGPSEQRGRSATPRRDPPGRRRHA